MIERFSVRAPSRGLHEITGRVEEVVARSGVREGLCVVFVTHTSASLLIQENADPSARRDLEAWLARLAPEGDPAYTHTSEGPDDMPAHLRAAVTPVSLSIPIEGGRLTLGAWQGVYLWEHRARARDRTIVVHISG